MGAGIGGGDEEMIARIGGAGGDDSGLFVDSSE